MPYSAQFTNTAVDDFATLDGSVAQRVRSAVQRLVENVESTRRRALSGPYRGQFRTRVGDYRVLYRVDWENRVITVLRVGHRREIYRGN